MYWRDFKVVDKLPETGEYAVCFITPDNSWWEYKVQKKIWAQISVGRPNDNEFRNLLTEIDQEKK